MFIRAKKREGKIYYYIVEGIRKKNKVNQKVRRYIGTAENLLKSLKQLDDFLKGSLN